MATLFMSLLLLYLIVLLLVVIMEMCVEMWDKELCYINFRKQMEIDSIVFARRPDPLGNYSFFYELTGWGSPVIC